MLAEIEFVFLRGLFFDGFDAGGFELHFAGEHFDDDEIIVLRNDFALEYLAADEMNPVGAGGEAER